VPAQVLGGAVDYKISPQFQRLLQGGRGERIVYAKEAGIGFCNFSNGFNIADLQGRVGGCFEPDQPGIWCNRIEYIFGIRGINIIHGDPEFLVHMREETESAAVDIINSEDLVTAFQ